MPTFLNVYREASKIESPSSFNGLGQLTREPELHEAGFPSPTA